MKFKDYYEVLGVTRTATDEEIKLAYRKLARKFHPDVSKEAEAEDRFKEIGEAYAVLKDPEKRAAYDQIGSQSKHGQDFTPPPNWDAGFEFSGGGFDGNAQGNSSEFFEALFGRHARNNRSQNVNAKGQDHHAKVMIDLIDTYHGTKKNIALQMPSRNAQGQMVMQERILEVNIPKGIHAGQHLRLNGQGAPGIGSGPAGDLYLEVSFKPSEAFRVDDRDVYMNLPISPWEAALGSTIIAPTPSGLVDLKIPPGSNSGRKLRLKGRGIPGSSPGDLYIELTIVIPPADTEKAKDAYRVMSESFEFNPRQSMKGTT